MLITILFSFGSGPFRRASAASGTTYVVAPSGSDQNAGTEAEPFKTIQRGIDAAQPGDTILVKPGTYTGVHATYGHAEFNPNADHGHSGTESAPVTLKAQYPATEVGAGQRSVLMGQGSGFGFYVAGESYITIEGFEIVNWEGGIGLHGQANHLIVRKNVLRSNTATGIECASCSDNLIEYNAFLDPGPPYPELADAVQDYGINFYQGSADNRVVHNYFFGKHNQALSWKRKAGPGYAAFNTFEGCMYTCLYLGQNDDEADGGDMTSFEVMVEHNVFRDAVQREDDALSGASAGDYYRVRTPITIRNIQNAVVRYNFVENSVQSPVYVVGCEGGYYCQTHQGRQSVDAQIYGNTFINTKGYQAFEIVGRGYDGDDIQIYNNTVFNTDLAFTIEGSNRDVPSTAPPNLTIKDNNFVDVGNGVSGTLSTTTFGTNNWYPQDNRQSGTDLNLDPMFAGPFTGYDPNAHRGPSPLYEPSFARAQAFRLLAGSPLIDAGADVGLPYDGAAPDIGSNEFIPDGSGPTPTPGPTAPAPSPTDTPPPSMTPVPSPSPPPSPAPAPPSGKPYPAGDGMPFGFIGCDASLGDIKECLVTKGYTIAHPSYYSHLDAREAFGLANQVKQAGLNDHYIVGVSNDEAYQFCDDPEAFDDFWRDWFSTVAEADPLGYYLPDEPDPAHWCRDSLDNFHRLYEILKEVDPDAIVIDYGLGGGDWFTQKYETWNIIDVAIEGGYTVYHPEYGGHGYVLAKLYQAVPFFQGKGKTVWFTTEGFGDACRGDLAYGRTASQIAMSVVGGAQGIFTYSYGYARGTPCEDAHNDWLPRYAQIWPWILEADRTRLDLAITSGPEESPAYNLESYVTLKTVQAWLMRDPQGTPLIVSANVLDGTEAGYSTYTAQAEIPGVPAGTYEALWEGRTVKVGEDGILRDTWAPLGYHFYLPACESSFADVSCTHWAHDYIEVLYREGYTAGCGTDPLIYCPDDTMSRGESAVFVERGIHSVDFDPPQPGSQTFADVALDAWFARWVTALWDDGYTAGCQAEPLMYCPFQSHTRAEGAVFYLRMLYGADYEPPAAGGIFADVAVGAWYANWAEAAYGAGLIPACSQPGEPLRFCPDGPLTRGLAAYMMVQAKGLK